MKLNVARPNKCNAATANCARLLLALAIPLHALIFNCAVNVSCSQPDESGEKLFRIDFQQQARTSNENLPQQTSTSRGVSNLHLTSDFRSVKLRWNFEHSSSNEPASFRVRYCELTSWNIEIKCRSRELRVASGDQSLQQQDNNHWTVITAPPTTTLQQADSRFAPVNFVQQLDPPLGSLYEAQIYDLRALTNYTFNVDVARFSHESIASVSPSKGASNSQFSSNRGQAGRRLSLADENHQQQVAAAVSGRIETKPFGAEATKCLADVSELVVNTGKYFGGRISVEGSTDSRCTLIGNRTSDQSSYLFRIDHEICGSKTVDGRRIESMVLVHENKDILTHNSARFLVVCNFLQKSFTLRASVSLPKVNGLLAPSKPAVITSLPGKPTSQQHQFDLSSAASSASLAGISASRAGGDDDDRQVAAVMLGSMPGIYRARTGQQERQSATVGADPPVTTDSQQPRATASEASGNGKPAQRDANRTGNSNLNQRLDELDVENNTIEKFPVAAKVAAAQAWQQQRQPKELDFSSRSSENSNSADGALTPLSSPSESNAVSRLTQHLQLQLQPPAPVQVQSKMLFVDRGSQGTRLARQHDSNNGRLAGQQVSGASLLVRSSQLDTTPSASSSTSASPFFAGLTAAPPTIAAQESHKKSAGALAELAERGAADFPTTATPESLATPILMTNNHRVSSEFLPVAQSSKASATGDGYSIKYSAAQVGEYSLGGSSSLSRPERRSTMSGGSQLRARNGRMRSVDHQAGLQDQQLAAAASSLAPIQTTGPITTSSSKPSWSVSERMGELASVPMRITVSSEPSSSYTQPSVTGSTVTTPTFVNSTLAHNITSYLLKWSLKTLSNLAKNSLESLIESGDYVNGSEPLQVGSNSDDGESRGVLFGQSLKSLSGTTNSVGTSKSSRVEGFRGGDSQISANSITTTTTPTLLASNPNETRSLEPPEPTKSMLNQQQPRPSDEPMLDGFITSSSPPKQLKDDNNGKKASLSNSIHSNSRGGGADNNNRQQQQLSRPSNHSESLDFNKSFELPRTRSTPSDSNEIKSKVISNLGRLGHQRQQSLATTENGKSSATRSPIQSAWLLYGLAMLVALLVGLFLILWSVSASQSQSHSSSSPSLARLQSALSEANTIGGENRRRVNPIASDRQLPASGGFRLADDDEVTYQKYDYSKFENYSSGTAESGKNLAAPANLLLLAANTNRPTTMQQQESPRSPTARSSMSSSSSGGSANTMLMSNEHDCRNSELLYNEHALATNGTNLGESYA